MFRINNYNSNAHGFWMWALLRSVNLLSTLTILRNIKIVLQKDMKNRSSFILSNFYNISINILYNWHLSTYDYSIKEID